MGVLIILIVLVVIGLVLIISGGNDTYEGSVCVGWLMVIGFGIWLIIRSVNILTKEYYYSQLVTKRESFQRTLTNIRNGENKLETAVIAEKVIDFNMYIEERKHDNTTWYYGDIIDDRITYIEPITIE